MWSPSPGASSGSLPGLREPPRSGGISQVLQVRLSHDGPTPPASPSVSPSQQGKACAYSQLPAPEISARVPSRPTSEQAGNTENVLLPKRTPPPRITPFPPPLPVGAKPAASCRASSRPSRAQQGLFLRHSRTALLTLLCVAPVTPPDLRMESTHSPPSSRRGPTSSHFQASLPELQPSWPLFCPANTPRWALPPNLVASWASKALAGWSTQARMTPSRRIAP